MGHRWIVTALGKDRPGIVAGVTEVLYRLGCNLEDSAMTRLGGEFTIMLVFSAPSGLEGVALHRAFEPLEGHLRLATHLKPLTASEAGAPRRRRGRRYLISVYGADRPGIVFRIADLLSRARVNITDVHTHRSPGGGKRAGPSLYLLLLEVELPPARSPAALERRLKRTAKRMGIQVGLRPSDAAIL